MRGTTYKFAAYIAIVAGLWSQAIAARGEADGADILEGFDISARQIERLRAGDVLAFSDGEYENHGRELATDAMALVDSDFESVLDALEKSTTLIPTHVLIDHAAIDSEADFAGVEFTMDDMKQVESLFADDPGKEFNLGVSDIAILEKWLSGHRDSSAADKIAAASKAMRAILIRRYNDYRAKGLQGIDPYIRGKKKQVDVGAELRLTTDTFQPFEADYPQFIGVMYDYPQGAECCTHHFRWLKVKLGKRIGFALSHTIIQVLDDTALVTERHYYVSTLLNSVQITTAWAPYREGGYLGLAMSASADVLDSFIGRVFRKLGRNLAKNMVTDVMVDIKGDLEARAETLE